MVIKSFNCNKKIVNDFRLVSIAIRVQRKVKDPNYKIYNFQHDCTASHASSGVEIWFQDKFS